MVKFLNIIAVGLATTTLATLVGCSRAPEAEAPANTSNQESTAATDPENAPTQAEASADAEDIYRPVENITFPAPGSDPLAMVFGLRQFTGEAIGSEQLKITYPTPEQAIVVTTVRGLPDDSINAIRTRYEFQPVAGQTGQWQMVKVSQQNKCRSGRGPEDWTAELCQ